MNTRWAHDRVWTFFVNVIFENIILRKPIHSLLLFRAAIEISFDKSLKFKIFFGISVIFHWYHLVHNENFKISNLDFLCISWIFS